jgi:cytochrome c-type biogenesis protein CcmH/NrfF
MAESYLHSLSDPPSEIVNAKPGDNQTSLGAILIWIIGLILLILIIGILVFLVMRRRLRTSEPSSETPLPDDEAALETLTISEDYRHEYEMPDSLSVE